MSLLVFCAFVLGVTVGAVVVAEIVDRILGEP